MLQVMKAEHCLMDGHLPGRGGEQLIPIQGSPHGEVAGHLHKISVARFSKCLAVTLPRLEAVAFTEQLQQS